MTVKPLGKVSLKVMPDNETVFAAGFVSVKVNVVVLPCGIEVGENALLIVGGVTTSRLAVARLPVPPSVDVTLLVTLFSVPGKVAVTFTFTVHVPPAAIEPPLNDKLVSVADGEKVGVLEALQPVVFAFGVAATCIPAGSASANPTPVKVAPAFGFVIVNVIVLVPPTKIEFGEKTLLIVGGAITVKLAVAVLPFPPFDEVTVPVVLVLTPLVVPVTLTVIVQ